MKTALILLTTLLCFQTQAQLNHGPSEWNETGLTPIQRLRISDVELGSSLILFSGVAILPRTIADSERQGVEIACFVFGLTLFVDGTKMRRSVKDKRRVRYIARKS